jgi:hypothetical protein
MMPAVARKVRELVNAGATMIGPRPMTSPSLQDFPACDQEVQNIAAELWDSGRVVSTQAVAQVLASLNVRPDFQADAKNVVWIHRRIGNAEVYFVSNQEATERVVNCTFRVEGRQPEFWDAMTGEIREARSFSTEGGLTRVPIKFDPRGAIFVVFQKPARQGTEKPNWLEFELVQSLEGGWAVRFDRRWGGPGQVAFDSLDDWSKRPEPGIRYYSGTAVYEKEFQSPGKSRGTRLFLDLGQVKNLAEVRLNGRGLGVVWKPPFRAEITKALRPGRNRLEVRVVNLWANRLIGDEQQSDDCQWGEEQNWNENGTTIHLGQPLSAIPDWVREAKQRPASGRYTLTSWKYLRKDSPLLESGLLGPVRVLSSKDARP